MAWAFTPLPFAPDVHLLAASAFTIEQLTQAYNQTRVDYLVPMPMNAARLAEYIAYYDVDLDLSVVSVNENQTITGLGMLGVRDHATWVTRLGVLPTSRRHGTGRAIMQALLSVSQAHHARQTILEVIKNNLPAYNLFCSCGFVEQRELLVLRRAPNPPPAPPTTAATWLNHRQIMACLRARTDQPSWLTANESLDHVGDMQGVQVTLANGGRGWLAFHVQRFGGFPMLLSRLVFGTEHGHPPQVAAELLAHLYTLYPALDTHTENIAADDPHLPALFGCGFFESFRRIEMLRPAGPLEWQHHVHLSA